MAGSASNPVIVQLVPFKEDSDDIPVQNTVYIEISQAQNSLSEDRLTPRCGLERLKIT